ncbi:DUF3291 domain-containing protein [Pseudomonas sp. UL073]|uniref:DUF3291 domain-containing protein n=1 Tax=Zestomonas insulae TaxID=2809017 RepID=A0ABS2IBQ0_9GAMM|nr:DUF3291 domain-containing protein [Pseudomonas insulae]MBM7059238.1 DUF3291 domain-containing protein [Pseudomonas insulae]
MQATYHLAQINIAKARELLDHPLLSGFVAQLDTINALAERSPGFVWRLQTEEGDATSIQAFDDPQIIVNMSLWTSFEALKDYVYSGDHLAVLRQRASWMEKLATPSLALWWLPAGTLPSVDDGKRALRLLAEQGPSAAAFTFARSFAAPGAAESDSLILTLEH